MPEFSDREVPVAFMLYAVAMLSICHVREPLCLGAVLIPDGFAVKVWMLCTLDALDLSAKQTL